jgi:hypothetical protein
MWVRTGASRAVIRHGRRGGFRTRSPRVATRGFLDHTRYSHKKPPAEAGRLRVVRRPGCHAKRFCASAALLLWLAAAVSAAAAGLDEPVRASWQATPLHAWSARAAALAGMPVIIDRRLDPSTPVTLAGRGEPLREVMAEAAAAADAEVAVLRSSIRIVPRGTRDLCERADEAREREVARLPAAPRTALRARSPWQWPEAARPRDLVAAVAAEAGIDSLHGLDSIPHDHFPAADLPALSRAEKLDLVLAHFDRRVEWRSADGAARGTIVPLDTNLPAARRAPARKPGPSPPRSPAPAVFSLRVAAPLDEVLAALATQFGLRLDLDRDSLRTRGVAPREIVRADIRDAPRDQVLDHVLGPLGLEWRIEGERLRVFASPSPGSPE